jgi:RND family efflux transporter MFP subunit
MKRQGLHWLCVIVVALTGCRSTPQDIEPDELPGGGAVTLWTGHTELFMEYPALLVGKEARLAVHLTWLDTFRPVSSGSLRLRFQSTGGAAYVTQTDGPSSPGIFRPTVTFDTPGIYDLTMIVEGDRTDTLHVRAIRVFASADELPSEGTARGIGEEEIPFLKEQQWNTDFRTEAVRTALLRDRVHAHGEIIPRLKSEVIVSAPFTGVVFADENRAMPVTGSRVSKGSKLVVLRPSAQSANEGDHFAARYAQAEHEQILAMTEYQRMQRLYAKEAVPLKLLQEAEARLTHAEAMLATLNRYVQRSSSEKGGSDGFELIAPISGTIVDTYVVPGKQIAAGAPLFQIIDMQSVWLRASVPVTETGRIHSPQDAVFRVPGFEQNFMISELNGKLVSFGSVVDNQTRSVPIIYEVANPDHRLRIGMFAEVLIAAGRERAVTAVPETALMEDEGRYTAFVQISGEAFARRVVQTGVRDHGMVEITSGLTAGERVVTVGAYQVRLASMSTELPEHGHEH